MIFSAYGLKDLKEFLGFLNNVHPSIKFTMVYYQKQINILDVLISKNYNESSLITTLFTKSFDTHQYLHATHVIDQFIKSQDRMAKLFKWKEFVQMKLIYNGNCWI